MRAASYLFGATLCLLSVSAISQTLTDTAQTQQPAPLQITRQGGSVPVPDPTSLTTAQLNREIELLKSQIQASDDAIRELIHLRFDSIKETIDLRNQKVDDAIAARNIKLDDLKAEIDRRLLDLQDLINERFARVDAGFTNVDNQFTNRDTALDAALTATQTAANNALTATKEAVETAGVVTKDLINQQGDLLNASMNGLRISVAELQRRADILEGRTAGLGEQKTSSQDNTSLLMAVVATILSLVSVGSAIIFGIMKSRSPEREREPRYPEQIRYVQVAGGQQVPPPGVTTTTNTVPG